MDNQVVAQLPGKLTKSQKYLLPHNEGLNLFETCCTYSTVFTLGGLDGQSRGSEFILSHDRFVGFRSIRQKRHNYGALSEKMAPCRFSTHRSKNQKAIRYGPIQRQNTRFQSSFWAKSVVLTSSK